MSQMLPFKTLKVGGFWDGQSRAGDIGSRRVCILMYMTRHECKRRDANVENADPDTDPAPMRAYMNLNVR